MFIVTADHPHYPQIAYCETLSEANEERVSFMEDLFSDNGGNECTITIAEVIEAYFGKSDY